ncbi:MAG: hypothetical protein HC906_15620 [Bacteroidales bacterium]|nr:hypothetical protein [Bacteroidales bacterium]
MNKLSYIDIFEGKSFFIADTVFNASEKTNTHTHDFFEIFILKKGELIHSCNNSPQILKEGDICFIHPEDFHWFQVKDNRV